MSDAWMVEVLLLRAGSGWSYRRVPAVPAPGESPDAVARRVAGPLGEDHVVHSTSWRHLPDGRIVLTYVVCPDPVDDAPHEPLLSMEIARGDSPAVPTPARVEVGNVVAHAIQHLAVLMITDPVVRQALTRRPDLAEALAARLPALAAP